MPGEDLAERAQAEQADGGLRAHLRSILDHATTHVRQDRSQGQPPVPRSHDVRRLGQPRPRRVDRDHPSRARRGDQLHRHRRRLRARRVRGDRRQGAGRRPARQRLPRHQGARDDGRRPQPVRQLAPLDHRRGREQPAPPGHRLDRPLPDPPPRARHRHRRDARRADRPRPRGQGALHRQLDLPAERDRRGPVGGRAARARALRLRAAAVLDPRARRRGRRAADLPALRHGRHPVEPAGRRLADRALPQGPGPPRDAPRPAHPAALRHVAARQPGQARGRRRARAARRGGRAVAHRHGAGLRPAPPGDHRARSSARARWSSSSPSSAPPT